MDVDKLRAEVLELEPELVDMRRRLHRSPELSYKEFSTSKFVADTLRKYGVEVTEKVGGTGVPDQMYMEGTLRTLDENIRGTMKEKIKNIAENDREVFTDLVSQT